MLMRISKFYPIAGGHFPEASRGNSADDRIEFQGSGGEMKNLSWRQSLRAVAFFLSLCVAVIFVVRAVRPIIYWHYHQDEPIRGWMNLGYVAHSYHVPPHVLHSALGLPDKPDKRPLREIAREQNRSMDEIRSLLLQAIVQARQPYPASPSPPTNSGASP